MSLVAANLGKRFNRDWIFRNFNYQFDPGHYVVTGPNGSGKSTLLQVLWGQMQPSTGTVTWPNVAPEAYFQQVSIAAPYMDLIDEFTLEEMVRFHFKFKKCRLPLGQVFERINLPNAQDRPIASFSSGMRQRLKLALAFYADTDALFLDEPCTNLDQKATEWYHEQLRELQRRKIVIDASNQESEYPADAVKIDILSFK